MKGFNKMEHYLTIKELMERWRVSYNYLSYLRRIKSRPVFVKRSGIRYPLSEIDEIDNNKISLPSKK